MSIEKLHGVICESTTQPLLIYQTLLINEYHDYDSIMPALSQQESAWGNRFDAECASQPPVSHTQHVAVIP